MARPETDEDEDKPLDPAVENVRRKLVRFALVNLGLLFLALMAVVVALVYKSRTAERAPTETVEADIVLPAGARVATQSLSGDRILLEVRLADGSTSLFVYDTSEGRLVGRFAIKSQ